MAVRIIPYLVAILFAIGDVPGVGAMDYLMRGAAAGARADRHPAGDLPMAIIRPLSGGGSLGVLGDMVKTHGLDSIFVKMAGIMYGACETTFYVIAVYFGAVGIKKTRHAIAAGLTADISAMIIAVWLVRLLYG